MRIKIKVMKTYNPKKNNLVMKTNLKLLIKSMKKKNKNNNNKFKAN